MELLKIKKRNKKIVNFDIEKIQNVIKKAQKATDNQIITKKEFSNLMSQIENKINQKINSNNNYLEIEQIQDIIEEELFNLKKFKILRNFISYREKHNILRDDKNAFIDSIDSINEYIGLNDWRIKENANQGYSIGGLILNTSGKVTANYWLKHIYSSKIRNAHMNGDFHIHDLSMLAGYCTGWSLRQLLNEGFNGVPNKVESSPPKHLSSALAQMINFFGTLQNEWAGAQAFSSFDTYLAPYIYKDKLSYQELKQLIQQFVFNLNVPSRWGCQTPFTNLTLDWVVPQDLKDQVPMSNNKPLIETEPELTYANFQKEMDMLNKAFLEVMSEGDMKKRTFTFPIPTYNITEDFDWENENTNLLFEITAKYGIPYFQNFIGSQYKKDNSGNLIRNEEAYTPGAVRSMCCRLQLDLNELLKRGGGLFGSAEMTGSIGVVTLNMARLGFLHKQNKKEFYKAMDELLYLAKESLEMKRKIMQKNLDNGLYPYTKRYLPHLNHHFSTIGINGLNEMIRNFTLDKEDISTQKGISLSLEILNYIRNKMKQFQEETGNLYNLEATPAEGTTYRFAKLDKEKFKNEIIQAGFGENMYYTNSSQLPVTHTDDPFEALNLQDELQLKYTGGTVLHLYLGEKMNSSENCKKFVKQAISNYKLPYITITPSFSICPKHNYLKGEQKTCPKCGSKCEIWTRVMGYYRPISQFNKGKFGEKIERINYKTQCQT